LSVSNVYQSKWQNTPMLTIRFEQVGDRVHHFAAVCPPINRLTATAASQRTALTTRPGPTNV
jgi:hypothetical protein